MAEKKMSTLILKVDLDCCSCYKKIRKILCKLQDHEGIRTISYDNGSNTIAVVGPFDPHRLSCKIRCKAGKVIKGIDIIQHDGGGGGGGGGGEPPNMAGPPAVKNGKKKPKGKPKEKENEPHQPPPHELPPQQQLPPTEENPPPAAQPAAPDSHISAGMLPTYEEMKPGEMPAAAVLEPPPQYFPPAPQVEQNERPHDQRLQPPPARPIWPVDVKPSVEAIEIPSWPAPPQPIGTAGSSYGCSCCQPCYRGYYEGCRCCNCGRVYGYSVGVLPTPAGCYAGGSVLPTPAGCYASGSVDRPGCQLYGEEDPASACAVM